MKIQAIFLATISLLGTHLSSAAVIWSDFTDFNNNPTRNGISLSLTNGTVNEDGHIVLSNGAAQFNFSSSPQRPNFASGSTFSVAMTYGSGSIQSLAPLFSWGCNQYPGLFGASYDPANQTGSVAYWSTTQTASSFQPSSLANLDPSAALTVVFSKLSNGKISYSFYSDDLLVGTLTSSGELTFSNTPLMTLTLGGKGSSTNGYITNGFATGSTMDIIGLSYQTGGTFTDTDMTAYFKEVLPVPEPGTASLGLLALSSLMFRRKRS